MVLEIDFEPDNAENQKRIYSFLIEVGLKHGLYSYGLYSYGIYSYGPI